MISLPLPEKTLPLRTQAGVAQVFDPIRRLWVVLTPEEHVRQLLLHHLLEDLHYTQALIAIERKLDSPLPRRFDLVVYDRNTHQPWLLAECKAPEVPIDEAAFYQLLAYQRTLSARYWLLTNGINTFCADASDPTAPKWLAALPPYEL
jgi:hypothetical protein